MKKLIIPILICVLIIGYILYGLSYSDDSKKEDKTNSDIESVSPIEEYIEEDDQKNSISSTTHEDSSEENPINDPLSTPNNPPKVEAASETTENASITKEYLSQLVAGDIIDVVNSKEKIIKVAFYYEKIDDHLKKRITGKSYKKNASISYEDLRYVRVLYYGFDKNTHIGELIVNKKIAKDITEIFKELYLLEYPIEKMHLIDDYDGDDEASMADNNTSAFNYRAVTGSNKLSKHALGLAIDINPLYNPYVKISGGKTIISPESGSDYVDRTIKNDYYITKNDSCYMAFTSKGFTWGGNWKSLKDYQHFEK